MRPRRFAIGLAFALAAALPAHAAGLDLDDTALVTASGEPVSFSPELFDAPATVVSFTFSGCSSICPVSDLVMNDLAVASRAADVPLSLLTVTLDPLNDTPEVLAAHRDKYGFTEQANWRWLTGDAADVFGVLERLGMRRGALDDHPSFFLVVGRDGTRTQSLWEATATTETLLQAVRAMSQSGPP
jgi:protein SCO1/2